MIHAAHNGLKSPVWVSYGARFDEEGKYSLGQAVGTEAGVHVIFSAPGLKFTPALPHLTRAMTWYVMRISAPVTSTKNSAAVYRLFAADRARITNEVRRVFNFIEALSPGHFRLFDGFHKTHGVCTTGQ